MGCGVVERHLEMAQPKKKIIWCLLIVEEKKIKKKRPQMDHLKKLLSKLLTTVSLFKSLLKSNKKGTLR